MPPSTNNRMRGLAVLAGLVLAVLAFGFTLLGPAEREASQGPGRDPRTDKYQTTELLYSINPTDPKELAAASDNVFVGTVERRAGQDRMTSTIPGGKGDKPTTQYAVRVGEVLKSGGEQPAEEGSELVVSQIGGEMNGRVYRAVGVFAGREYPDAPLVEGSDYLFSTAHTRRGGYQEISAQPHGDVPLAEASDAETKRLLEAFRGAVEGS